jgi:hypothetical protein
MARKNLLPEAACRRDNARINADDGATIGLRGAARGIVVRAADELLKLGRNADAGEVERQLRAEQMQLFEVEVECPLALHADGPAQDLGIDERITVAIAADPTAHAEEGGDLDAVPSRVEDRKLVLEHGVDARDFTQEGVIVVRKAVGDLVHNRRPVASQHACLP